jgi:glycine cleavage system H lipoate-binding protein
MKEWNANNPTSPANAAPDPELSGWLAELRRLEPQKKAIIP